MAIRTIDDLRAQVPENLRGLDEESLVREYSRATGYPLEKALDYFGIKPDGTGGYLMNQTVGGFNDAQEMIGRGLQYFDRETGLGGSETGAEWEAAAAGRQHMYAPDDRNRGAVAKFAGVGLRAAATAAPVIGAAVLNPYAGGVAAAGLFGGGSAEETYRNVLEQTGDEQAAYEAARQVGLVQGAGEGAMTAATGGLIRSGRALLPGARAATAAGVAEKLTKPVTAKQFAGQFALTYPMQVGTEVVQDVATNNITRAYGGKVEQSDWDTAKDSAYGAAAMNTVLGPFAGIGHVRRNQQAAQLKHALFGRHNDEALRAQAIDVVLAEARRQKVDPANIDQWFEAQLRDMDKAVGMQEDARAQEILRTAPSYEQVDPAAWEQWQETNRRYPVERGEQYEIDLLGGQTRTPYTPAPAPLAPAEAAPTASPDQIGLFDDPRSAGASFADPRMAPDTRPFEPLPAPTPQMGLTLDGAGTPQGYVQDAGLRTAQQLAPEVEPARLNLRQTDMFGGVNPVYDRATDPQVNPQGLLPAPSANVRPASGTRNVQNTTSDGALAVSPTGTVRPLSQVIAEHNQAMALRQQEARQRLAAQGDTVVPADAPVASAEAPQTPKTPARSQPVRTPGRKAYKAKVGSGEAAQEATVVINRGKDGTPTRVTIYDNAGKQLQVATKLGKVRRAGATPAEIMAYVDSNVSLGEETEAPKQARGAKATEQKPANQEQKPATQEKAKQEQKPAKQEKAKQEKAKQEKAKQEEPAKKAEQKPAKQEKAKQEQKPAKQEKAKQEEPAKKAEQTPATQEEKPAAEVRQFISRESAEAAIEREGLGDTHEVVQTAKNRFSVQPKAEVATPEAAAESAEDSAPAKRESVLDQPAKPLSIKMRSLGKPVPGTPNPWAAPTASQADKQTRSEQLKEQKQKTGSAKTTPEERAAAERARKQAAEEEQRRKDAEAAEATRQKLNARDKTRKAEQAKKEEAERKAREENLRAARDAFSVRIEALIAQGDRDAATKLREVAEALRNSDDMLPEMSARAEKAADAIDKKLSAAERKSAKAEKAAEAARGEAARNAAQEKLRRDTAAVLGDAPVDDAPVGADPLFGDVEGAAARTVTGRVTLPQSSMEAVRDALNRRRTVDSLSEEEARIYRAIRAVEAASAGVSSSAQNLLKSSTVAKISDITNLDQYAEGRLSGTNSQANAATSLRSTAENLRSAVAELVSAAGSGKNVEALVAVIKADAQRRIAGLRTEKRNLEAQAEEQEVDQEAMEEVEGRIGVIMSLDVAVSSAWSAFKRGALNGDAVDLADISPNERRDSTEIGNKGPTPLERKAAESRVLKQYGTVTGLLNVLYDRFEHSTTPMGQMLGRTLFRALHAAKNRPKLQFVDGVSSYDPKTNTIFLNRFASDEVVLHETLHAALQWYVYSKWDSGHFAIEQLKRSLQQVRKLTGLTGRALEAQTVINDLYNSGSEQDAVLEMISYGVTLNEFRRALEGVKSTMPETMAAELRNPSRVGITDKAAKAFRNVWTAITNVMARMLNVRPSAASDILMSSLKLLEETAASGGVDKAAREKGKTLYAKVQSADVPIRTFLNSPSRAPRAEGASPVPTVSDATYKAFTKGPGRWKTPTQIAFEYLGFGVQGYDRATGKPIYGKSGQALTKAAGKAAEYIRQNHPMLERVMLAMNSRFSNVGLDNRLFDNFKDDRNTGYIQMENIAKYLKANPKVAGPFIAYMDGDTKALDDIGPASKKMKSTADSMKRMFEEYIATLPMDSKERKFFYGNDKNRAKFSQYLLFASNVSNVAGTTFGVKKLADMVGKDYRRHPSFSEFAAFVNFDANGQLVDGDTYYELLQESPIAVESTGVKKGDLIPMGFISTSKVDNVAKADLPAGLSVDRTKVWRHRGYEANNHVFYSNMTVREAVEQNKVDELTTAMLNTTAALAHTFASRRFIEGMVSVGRDPVTDAPTAQSVAFESVAQINKLFPGRTITEDNVLRASDDAADAEVVRAAARNTGTWVRLPGTEENPGSYGALAGAIVPGPVWNSMLDMQDRKPLFSINEVNEAVRLFKKSKTIYNPGTHVTNIASNVTLALLHDVPMTTVGKAATMLGAYELTPGKLSDEDLAMVQAFLDSGATLGEFSSSEVKQEIYKQLVANISPKSDQSTLSKLATWARVEKVKAGANWIDEKMTAAYAAEDNAFRLAAFLKVAGDIQFRDGTDTLSKAQLKEAGLAARKMFLDYDIDARAVRAARNSFLPFVSWSYAITPVLGRIALTKPWTIANVMLAYAVLAGALEGDDEERKDAPEYLRNRALGGLGPYMHLRVPFMGDDENPVYFNLGKYIPMFSLFEPPPGEGKALGMDAIPGFLSPSGPLMAVPLAMAGFDQFTGEPFRLPSDTQWEKLAKTRNALTDVFLPPVLNTRSRQEYEDWAEGTKADGTEPSSLFFVRKFGGMGFYEYNVQESQVIQEKIAAGIKRDFEDAMREYKRNELEKGYPDYEALDAKLADLRGRMEQRMAEARGEEWEGGE